MSESRSKINIDSITAAIGAGTKEAQKPIERLQKKSKKASTQMGRPKVLAEDVERIQLKLPKALVRAIKQEALDTGKTESVVVALWLKSKF